MKLSQALRKRLPLLALHDAMQSAVTSSFARLLVVAYALTVALAQPRRGPPRGPIKEDKSTFFGKEGEQAQVTTDPMLSLGLKVAVVVLGGLVLYVNVFAGGGKGGGKKNK